jgi:hypothetical protein
MLRVAVLNGGLRRGPMVFNFYFPVVFRSLGFKVFS